MTGFGDARRQADRLSIAVEVRAVNNRYLKINTRFPETYAALEGRIEKTVRQAIGRGTVSLTVRVDRLGEEHACRINHDALRAYWQQLADLSHVVHVPLPGDLSGLLMLPGVVTEADAAHADVEHDWPPIQSTLTEALQKLEAFRRTEGESMGQELRSLCGVVARQIEAIARRAPQIVVDYRDRLQERVRDLLSTLEASVGSADLIREVSIFAERCDITEELTRMRSHLGQFEAFLDADASQGRKLDFLSQEMFREVNTIGAKANDVEIAHAVVEMKAAVEKIREILQNVE